MILISLNKATGVEIKLPTLISNLGLPYSGAIIDEKVFEDFTNYLTDNSDPQGHSKMTAL